MLIIIGPCTKSLGTSSLLACMKKNDVGVYVYFYKRVRPLI